MERTTAQSNMLTAGIDIIDEAWGGLYRGAAYLLYGPAAAGRGLLPLLFAQSGASRGERCLYVSAGRPRDLTLQAASLGFDLRAAYDDGRVRLVRIPPVFDTSEEGDDALVNALRGLAAEAAQHRPDRLIIDDFTPFVQFRSFERFGVSLSRLFEALPEQTTLMLALGEPASPQSDRVIQFVRNQVFGTLHLELTEEEAPSTRRLILVPNIGHLRHEVIDDWDLETLVESVRQAAEPETVQEETPTVDPHDFAEQAATEALEVAEEEAIATEAVAPEEDVLDEAEPAAMQEDWAENAEEASALSLESETYDVEQEEEEADEETPSAFAENGEMDEVLTVADEEDEQEAYEAFSDDGEEEEITDDEAVIAEVEEEDAYEAAVAHTEEDSIAAVLEEPAYDEEYEEEDEEEADEAPALEAVEDPPYDEAEAYEALTEESPAEEAEDAVAEEAFAEAPSEDDETWAWEDEEEEEPVYDAFEEPDVEAIEAIEGDVEEELKYFSASEMLDEDEPEEDLDLDDESDPLGPTPDFTLGEPAVGPSVRAIPLGRARAEEEVATLASDPFSALVEADEAYASDAPSIGFEEEERVEEDLDEVHEYEAFFDNGGTIDEGIDEELLDIPALPEVDYTDRVEFRVRLQQHFLRLAVNNAPFVLIALRMDRREDTRVRPFDFDFLQDLIATLLREEDDLLVDLEQERLIVLLGESEAETAQAFFGQLKNRLRDETPHQSEYLLHSVSAIVVPNGRPFDTAEEFLTYALDQP